MLERITPFFGVQLRLRLGEIEPRDVKALVRWLMELEDPRRPGRLLGKSTIRQHVAVVRAMMGLYVREPFEQLRDAWLPDAATLFIVDPALKEDWSKALPDGKAEEQHVRLSFNADLPFPKRDTERWDDAHARWCYEHSLFLHVSHHCLTTDDEHYDPLFVRGFTGGLGENEQRSVDDLVDALNALKQEFVAARYLTWLAIADDSPVREQARALSAKVPFHDSLLLARWGARTGLTLQALTAATNLLDKIAAFLHLYFRAGRPRQQLYFRGLWKAKGKPVRMEPAFSEQLPKSPSDGVGSGGNLGLLALCDLSRDLEGDTPLARLLALRHAASHRFLVAHHALAPESTEWLERMEWTDVVEVMLQQLAVGRAALVYLVRAVDSNEAKISRDDEAAGRRRGQVTLRVVDAESAEIDWRRDAVPVESMTPPARGGAAASRLDPALVSQLVEDEPDRGGTDFRKRALDVTPAKLRRRLLEDVRANALLLAAERFRLRGDALLEVLVGAGHDLGEVGRPRPDVVRALVPALLRLVQRGVVGVLRFEDALLDADVPRDAVTLREQLVRRDQPGKAAVAIGDGMNCEEVDDKPTDQDERVRLPFGLQRAVSSEELGQEELGLLRRRRSEDDLSRAALVGDDEILV